MEGKPSFGARAESSQGHYQLHEDASASLAASIRARGHVRASPRAAIVTFSLKKLIISILVFNLLTYFLVDMSLD